MYIEPNSTVELFKNLKLDYSNTMYFSSKSAQNTFFSGRKSYTLNENTYQRKDYGVFRCSLPISSAYDVNYMRFKNTSFEDKWFYAFVTNVEYVNNNMCNIYYTIDVIQTYITDWDLHECMIERQHSTTDVAGDNLMPENLTLGDIINNGARTEFTYVMADKTAYTGIICCAYNPLVEELSGSSVRGRINNIFTGLYLIFYDFNGHFNDFLEDLDSLAQYTDSIVSITALPTAYISTRQTADGFPHIESRTLSSVGTLDGYRPVNQKLNTYPYCYLEVSNDAGDSIDFRYELFTNRLSMKFDIATVISSTPEGCIYPENYDSQGSMNPQYTLTCNGFPLVGYQNDAYKAWLAMNYDANQLGKEVANRQFNIETAINQTRQTENVIGTMTDVGKNVLSGVGSAVTGNVFGAGVQAINAVGNTTIGILKSQELEYQQMENQLARHKAVEGYNIQESVARKLPNKPISGSTSLMWAITEKGFFFQHKCIRRQFAERIDKFFTMFGYAQNKVAVPNLNVRSRFTYIKTADASVTGNIPFDDKKTIQEIFNSGIRFWKDYSTFENYDLPNTIV